MGKLAKAIVGLGLILAVGALGTTLVENNRQPKTSAGAACPVGKPIAGRLYVQGRNVNFRAGPGTTYDRVVNRRATTALNQTEYRTLDSAMVLDGLCETDAWVQATIIEADGSPVAWETGWVNKQFARGDPSADQKAGLLFDVNGEAELTADERSLLRKGALRVLVEEPDCGKVFWGSRDSEKPNTYYVTCRAKAANDQFNVFFTREEVADGAKRLRRQ